MWVICKELSNFAAPSSKWAATKRNNNKKHIIDKNGIQ